MKKKALIVQGGWDGHEPELVSVRFGKCLENEGFEVEISDTLDVYLDMEKLLSLDLIVPCWTGGNLEDQQGQNVIEAVASGVGMAGCHGGMCDSFRSHVTWQFMTGGQWVEHPGGQVDYKVNIKKNSSSSIIYGINDFKVSSEQYYMHVDPAVNVLATTRYPTANGYHASNGEVDMPVIWTKMWGHGRVFYTSLGHVDNVFDIPEAMETMRRGMLWAAESKALAVANNLKTDVFKTPNFEMGGADFE